MMEALFALLITAFTLVVTLFSIAVSVVVPLLFLGVTVWLIAKRGGTLVVSGPLVHALQASSQLAAQPRPAPQPPAVGRVKVGRCPSCGANRSTPARSAYVYCDRCGQLMDWDFQAALSDRRSKAPGPAYEQLLARHRSRMAEARAAGDQAAYEVIQAELWDRYVQLCPAACPPRVGEPGYRARWIRWSARSQTAQDLDPGCQRTFEAQQAATASLQWDRSNPFQPKAELQSYRRLLEAVLTHQQQVVDHLDQSGLLADHPDHPERSLFLKMGTAAFVQGWLPFLPATEHAATLERTGLAGEYIEPTPVDLTKGTCPSCSAALEVLPDARRVVCLGCGHSVHVNGGTLPCQGCSAPVDIPPDASVFVCPFCDTRVERLRVG